MCQNMYQNFTQHTPDACSLKPLKAWLLLYDTVALTAHYRHYLVPTKLSVCLVVLVAMLVMVGNPD